MKETLWWQRLWHFIFPIRAALPSADDPASQQKIAQWMNLSLLNRLSEEMNRQMRVCNKNVANEGDAVNEQELKNVFLSFQQDVSELGNDPELAQMSLPDLADKLKQVAAKTVANRRYRSEEWATRLLHETIDNQRQLVERMPPSTLEREATDTRKFDIACPACAVQLSVEREYDGFLVGSKESKNAGCGYWKGSSYWSSISFSERLQLSGSCPSCSRELTLTIGKGGKRSITAKKK